MLNDPFVLAQAGVWAERLVKDRSPSVAKRLDAMFRTTLGRPARADEIDRFERFVLEVARLHDVPGSAVLDSVAVWRDVAHTLFNLQEFITIP